MESTTWFDRLPVIKGLRKAASDKAFEANTERNMFRGVFDTFAAAQASAPATRPVGYDNPDSAGLYLKRLRIDEHDYPAMFWIARSFAEGMRRVVDIGGAVGIKYYAFGKFIDLPDGIMWRVIDVPAVAQRGREFAQTRPSPGLEFSDNILDSDGVDVLFASGALQYLPETLPELLARLTRKPRRILINTTPIHANRSFFTLNSIGTAFCPYRVQGHDTFVDGVKSHGYRMRDEWRNIGKALQIPFDPEHSLQDYTGFCFDRVD
jgi:putative methyltransferase (TIGR04325 family)